VDDDVEKRYADERKKRERERERERERGKKPILVSRSSPPRLSPRILARVNEIQDRREEGDSN